MDSFIVFFYISFWFLLCIQVSKVIALPLQDSNSSVTILSSLNNLEVDSSIQFDEGDDINWICTGMDLPSTIHTYMSWRQITENNILHNLQTKDPENHKLSLDKKLSKRDDNSIIFCTAESNPRTAEENTFSYESIKSKNISLTLRRSIQDSDVATERRRDDSQGTFESRSAIPDVSDSDSIHSPLESSESSAPVSVVGGSIAGSIAILVLLIILVVWFARRRRIPKVEVKEHNTFYSYDNPGELEYAELDLNDPKHERELEERKPYVEIVGVMKQKK